MAAAREIARSWFEGVFGRCRLVATEATECADRQLHFLRDQIKKQNEFGISNNVHHRSSL